MPDGTSWAPGELPELPRTTPTPPAPTPPAQPPQQAGQLYGWETPGVAQPGPTAYGAPPTPAPPGTSPYGPPAPSPYGPPASSNPSPYGPPPVDASGFGTQQPVYGAPANGPYGQPPLGGYPYGQPAFAPAPYPPAARGTDGFAIAALVFGIVGGWLAFVFGFIALSRIKRSGQGGRRMAITGIVLACVWVVAGIGGAIAIPVILSERQDSWHEQCAAGDMGACDSLYQAAPDGSDEQAWADTCGGRTQGGTLCTEVTGVYTYGDDPQLDALWDGCQSGDMAACDDLYSSSEPGSDYEWFGATCGNRTDGQLACVAEGQDT